MEELEEEELGTSRSLARYNLKQLNIFHCVFLLSTLNELFQFQAIRRGRLRTVSL